MKRAPAARGDKDAGITQPRDHSLADPCTGVRPLGQIPRTYAWKIVISSLFFPLSVSDGFNVTERFSPSAKPRGEVQYTTQSYLGLSLSSWGYRYSAGDSMGLAINVSCLVQFRLILHNVRAPPLSVIVIHQVT